MLESGFYFGLLAACLRQPDVEIGVNLRHDDYLNQAEHRCRHAVDGGGLKGKSMQDFNSYS